MFNNSLFKDLISEVSLSTAALTSSDTLSKMSGYISS